MTFSFPILSNLQFAVTQLSCEVEKELLNKPINIESHGERPPGMARSRWKTDFKMITYFDKWVVKRRALQPRRQPSSSYRKLEIVRFEVIMVVKMAKLVFCVVTPCGLVGAYKGLGETYCLHLQGRKLVQPFSSSNMRIE
jgi:hypothetical protein